MASSGKITRLAFCSLVLLIFSITFRASPSKSPTVVFIEAVIDHYVRLEKQNQILRGCKV